MHTKKQLHQQKKVKPYRQPIRKPTISKEKFYPYVLCKRKHQSNNVADRHLRFFHNNPNDERCTKQSCNGINGQRTLRTWQLRNQIACQQDYCTTQ